MKNAILVGLLVVTLGLGYFVGQASSIEKDPVFEKVNFVQTPVDSTQDAASTDAVIPTEYEIKNVPFTSQAPLVNWDQLHDEACEEASLIIAKYYLSGESLTPELAEQEIQKMVSWEIDYFGSHKDLTAAEVAEMAEKYYQMSNLKVVTITSVDNLKAEISQNHLIIVPTAGRELGNPNFRSPGPVYHMLVISGYNSNQFITQDVGTRNGQNYIYDQNVLYNAIHDWVGSGESINQGAKNIIIVN